MIGEKQRKPGTGRREPGQVKRCTKYQGTEGSPCPLRPSLLSICPLLLRCPEIPVLRTPSPALLPQSLGFPCAGEVEATLPDALWPPLTRVACCSPVTCFVLSQAERHVGCIVLVSLSPQVSFCSWPSLQHPIRLIHSCPSLLFPSSSPGSLPPRSPLGWPQDSVRCPSWVPQGPVLAAYLVSCVPHQPACGRRPRLVDWAEVSAG